MAKLNEYGIPMCEVRRCKEIATTYIILHGVQTDLCYKHMEKRRRTA